MSLSKYYKKSDSFQPEKIVKQDEQGQQEWERTKVASGPESTPSKPAADVPPLPDQLPQQSAFPHELPDHLVGDSPPGDPDNADGMVAGTTPSSAPSPTAGFDPANYMEIPLAEAKIEEAYQRGLQQGREEAEVDFGDTQRAMLSACQQLDTIRETLITNSRGEVLEFAMAIAERIVRISVREQDRTVVATIDEALQQAVKSDEFTIYLHPKDYETVSNKTEELIAGLSGLNNIVVKQDIAIEQGGVKIESENCTIDGTIATQFDVIREELNKKL